MIRLKAIDLNSHRIETWDVSIPKENIDYLEDVKWRGLENNYTRIHLVSGKTIVVCEAIAFVEAKLRMVTITANSDKGVVATFEYDPLAQYRSTPPETKPEPIKSDRYYPG